jgi:riboflavin biosynthesis pyrimidine reductase
VSRGNALSHLLDSGDRLEALFDVADIGGGHEMPSSLREAYGGDLRLSDRVVYGNFVTSIDGIAAIRFEPRSSAIISGGNPGDRLVMGLLRAWADVVLIGAGTFRTHPGGMWTPSQAYPRGTDDFRELRERVGLPATPRLAVLSAAGELDVREPSIKDAVVITSESAKRRLLGVLPATTTVIAPGDGRLGPSAAIDVLRSEGHGRILAEGGPRVAAGLIEAEALDELFLTVSPVILGRDNGQARPGFVDGVALKQAALVAGTLLSIRKHGSHLFLRYELHGAESSR